MKYRNPISFLILLLLFCFTSFSQSVVNRANSSYTVQDSRGMWQYNAVMPRYNDTTAANTQIGIDSCGAIIFTYSTNSLWVRSCADGKKWVEVGSGGGGAGTVTSVSFTGGLISIADPTTTPAFTVAGTSGGIPYFSSSSTWASSAALAANAIVIGGGAGVAPSTTTTGTGVLTALGVNVGSAGAFVVNGGALGTPSSGTLTNATGLPIVGGTTGTLTIARGGTNLTALGTDGQLLRVNTGATALEYFTPTYVTGNIYTTNGTLSDDRDVDMGGNDLIFANGRFAIGGTPVTGSIFNVNDGAAIHYIDINPAAHETNFESYGDPADVTMSLKADFDGGDVYWDLHVIDATNSSRILAATMVDGTPASIISYIADTHFFDGNTGVGTSPSVDQLFLVANGDEEHIIINTTDFSSRLAAGDGTAGSSISFVANSVGNSVNFSIATDNGTNSVNINGDAETDALAYTAATHTFTGNFKSGSANAWDLDGNTLEVQQGGQGLLVIEPSTFSSSLSADDGTGNSSLRLQADVSGGDVNFSIIADDDNNLVQISGDAVANTLEYSAATHTFTGSILFDAGGTAAGSALAKLQSGSLLTAPEAGALEYDGNTMYVTTASGRGVSPSVMFAAIATDFTMANSNTEQPVFPTGFDVWTLQGNTTYFFEGMYYFTHLAVSHSLSLSFPLGGGASVTSINYTAMAFSGSINAPITAQTTAWVDRTSATAVNNAGANATEYVKFSGIIRMNAGGTVTPSITFSADPTGTILAKVGTFIRFTPIGTGSVTNVGNVQ